MLLTTAVLREAWATLPESSSRPLPATLAQSRNLAHASLETAVHGVNTILVNNTFCKPLSATILAKADLVGLGIQVSQVLIPEHPAVIEWVAMGAVVITISGIRPSTSFMTIVSLE